jgi:protein-L-isoaspartate O-methyltransferase
MKKRPLGVLLAIALVAACSRSQADRDSRIGRTTYDGSEDMQPASRTLTPEPTANPPSPLANDSAMKATPTRETEPAPIDAPTVSTQGAADAGATELSATDAGTKVVPDVIYVPTPQPIVDKMLELARVKKTDLVYDLGCGDGRIVVTAAKRYGARAIGFDIDPVRVAEAKKNVEKNKLGHLVSIEQKDIFTLDLSSANVVTLYLLPKLNDRLLPQLEKLAPGSRVVSHDYGLSGVKPVQHLVLKPKGEEDEHEIFFWTVPFERERTLPLPRPTVRPPTVP